MNEFIILTRLTTGDKYIIPLKRVVAISGTAQGVDVYIEGLNQWAQFKETVEEVAELLRKLSEW